MMMTPADCSLNRASIDERPSVYALNSVTAPLLCATERMASKSSLYAESESGATLSVKDVCFSHMQGKTEGFRHTEIPEYGYRIFSGHQGDSKSARVARCGAAQISRYSSSHRSSHRCLYCLEDWAFNLAGSDCTTYILQPQQDLEPPMNFRSRSRNRSGAVNVSTRDRRVSSGCGFNRSEHGVALLPVAWRCSSILCTALTCSRGLKCAFHFL